jgi:LysM repeat protein
MLQPLRPIVPRTSLSVIAVVWCALILLLSGCQPPAESVREVDERAYRRGKSLLREGRPDEALTAFLSVIAARPDAAESHLEAGLLYLNHIQDPVVAIYHFHRYIGIKPQSERTEHVRELITTARKEFARRLPGEPFAPQLERMDLLASLEAARRENLDLKRQVIEWQRRAQRAESAIADSRQQLSDAQTAAAARTAPITIESRPAGIGMLAPATPAATEPSTATVSAPRTYTVEAGDTLSRISQKAYGTSSRWSEIFEANRDQLPSPNALQVGQVLKLP